jgi:hypothetical protein
MSISKKRLVSQLEPFEKPCFVVVNKEKGFNNGFLFAQVQTLFAGNEFIFYVDHMALVYLVNKP